MKTLFSFPNINLGVVFLLYCTTHGILGSIWTFFQSRKQFRKGNLYKQKYILKIVLSSLMLLICMGAICMMAFSFFRTITSWRIEKSDVVTGYVENYRFEAEGPHDAEEFMVNGVRFSYITDGTAWFYSKPASRGGVIYGNGQFVEIRYLADTDGNHHILHIAEDPSKSINAPETDLRPKTGMTAMPWILLGVIILIDGSILIRRHRYYKNHPSEKPRRRSIREIRQGQSDG